MDKRYLEYILVLAETGNMTKAARKLYVSQPTLSQFLAKQEKEIGAPLFQRSCGVYTLTPVGNLYADYARKVLYLTNTLEKDIERISMTNRIRIGVSSGKGTQMLTSILVDFRKYYPNVELTLSSDSLLFMKNAISHGELDIAFVAIHSLKQHKKQSIELKKEEVIFAVPSVHPYCQTLDSQALPSLTIDELIQHFGNFPFIMQMKGSCIRHLIDFFFKTHNFNPIIACNTNSAQSIYDMVSSNIGVGFIPISSLIQSPQITYFSLKPKMYRIHAILYRKDLIMRPAHKYLIDLALNYVEKCWKDL